MAAWVIVVDDDMTNLKMAGHILSKANMRVTALKSGQALLDYIETNQTLIANILCSPARSEIRQLLCDGIQESLNIAFRRIERARKEKLDPDFRDFVIEFFTEAIAGMIARWAENPERRSREQIEAYLNQIFDEMSASIKHPKRLDASN